MERANVTLVVVPRDRFSRAVDSLESIYRHTAMPFKLVYVDGNSPAPVAGQFQQLASAHGFELLRNERYLTPNEARNIGLTRVETEFVVFLDNDLLVFPGWLEHLLRCAKETGATIVAPLYLEGEPDEAVVHMGGGTCALELGPEGRRLVEKHLHVKRPLSEVRPLLQRGAIDLFEFHCVLMRVEMLQCLGPFDEQLKSLSEHADFSLLARQAGHSIMMEPEALVTFNLKSPLDEEDLSYFKLRWSPEWNVCSLDRLEDKWDLARGSAHRANTLRWARQYQLACRLNSRAVTSVLGASLASFLTKMSFKLYMVQGIMATRLHRAKVYLAGGAF